MFSLSVTDTDFFQDMPTSTQALYFHLGMHGDDDGFVGSPKRILRAAGCNEDDLKLLVAKGLLIPFDSGVVVIRDWRINNTLKNDRYHATIYKSEKSLLSLDDTNRYQLTAVSESTRNQIGTTLEPEHNETKHNKAERNKKSADKPPTHSRFVPPSVEDVKKYCIERDNGIDPVAFVDYYAARGWVAGKSKMKDWRAAVRVWENRRKEETAGGSIGKRSGQEIPKLRSESDDWFD